MKKIISILLTAAVLLSAAAVLSGCGGNKYDLVLITDSGKITDKGFNQSAWDGMTEFATEKEIDCRYFIPASDRTADLLSQIRSAADKGARVIVMAGGCFEEAVYTVQDEYPGVCFVLINGQPHPGEVNIVRTSKNTAAVMFASEQAGFLAGYAAVSEGFEKLGFLGAKALPDTVSYGYGFLQGVGYASDILGVTVEVAYQYAGTDAKNDQNKEAAEKMFEDGADVLFVCGNDIALSAQEAAAAKRSYLICSDTDRRYDSGYVITSAVKGVSEAVRAVLRSVYDTKDFERVYGGRTTYFDAASGGAGLATTVINDENGNAFDRFANFSREDYDGILAQLQNGSITVKNSVTTSDPSGIPTAEEITSALGLNSVTLTLIR
ncbi:MAG: BMP family ABC transporter substrate-binding protein [Clostridia bacterium]|nr:BMP family ABC transporter substrate-binding protein [Clostridia bacterium]